MIERIDANPRASRVVLHGDMIYLKGLGPSDRTTGIKDQTRQVLSQIEKLLLDHGSDKKHMLSAMIHLQDIRERPAMNEVWEAWLGGADHPARTTVGAVLADPASRIEITVTAVKHAVVK